MSNQCKASVKRKDGVRQCQQLAVQGTPFCGIHNKKSKEVAESPQFKTGIYSEFKQRFSGVAPKLLKRISELREDPDLWSLKDDAAYVTALMDLRSEAVDEGVTLEHYRLLKRSYSSMMSAYRRGDDSFDQQLKDFEDMLNKGMDAFEGSQDIIQLIERRTDIIEAEQRMLHAKAYTLEVDQAYSLVMQVLGVVKANVRSSDELSAIRSGIAKLLKVYQEADDVIDAEVIDETISQHEINA